MNNKGAKARARLLKRQRAIADKRSAEAAVTDMELEQLQRDIQKAVVRRAPIRFGKMSVKNRRFFAKPS